MATKRITAAVADEMQPGEVVWDAEVRGFGLRYRARDKTYVVKTRIKGEQRVLTIGRHGRGAWGAETARREAIRLLGVIRNGQDPAGERDAERAAPTFAALAERYLIEYAEGHKKARTRVEDARLLRLHLLPAFGRMLARDIDKAAVARWHAGMRAIPVGSNRALALLSAILGWAERVGERPDGSNPCKHIDRFPEKARERLLSAVEIGRLGEALDLAAQPWTPESKAAWRERVEAEADAVGIGPASRADWIEARQPRRDSAEDWRAIAAVRLLIFTGARLSEILTLQWQWIDLESGVARLPDSKTGAKNLFLPPGALEVIAALPRLGDNPHVLPGDRPGGAFIGIQKPWQRIRALAGIPDVHIHDLRHAFASVAVAAGSSLFIVGQLLGHRQASTTQRYAHLERNPAQAVADRTAGRLAELLGGNRSAASGEVVALRPKALPAA